ncbi:MAG TPA: TlpA disulfide reductase family protein [Kofleriaceae bacterium]
MRAAAIGLVLVACGGAPVANRGQPQALPALELPLLDGGTWSSASARGSVLVIDIWASWCKPCSKGFPKLDALAAGDSKLAVIAITIDEDPAAIRAFLAEFPLAVPVAHDAKQLVTKEPLAIARLPAVLVIDRDGMIRHRLDEPTERDYDRLPELVKSAAADREGR